MYEETLTAMSHWGFFDWLCYFIYGNGLWLSSWEATHGDVFALMVRVVASFYLLYQHFRYCSLWQTTPVGAAGSPSRLHAHWFRVAMTWSLCTHVLVATVCVFVPLHYFVAILLVVNARQLNLACNYRQAAVLLRKSRKQSGGTEEETYVEPDESRSCRVVAESSSAETPMLIPASAAASGSVDAASFSKESVKSDRESGAYVGQVRSIIDPVSRGSHASNCENIREAAVSLSEARQLVAAMMARVTDDKPRSEVRSSHE